LLYLFLFITLNLPITLNDFVYMVKNALNGLYFSRHALAAYLFLVSLSLIIIDKFSLVHPFILADNRHYIFYIYRYFRWAQYPLCLVYPFCILSNIKLIVNSNEKLVKFIIWSVTSLFYLMLSPLVEFRYFAIPFVMLSLEIRNRNLTFDIEKVHKKETNDNMWKNKMIVTTLVKIALNAVIFYVFLFRPFGEGNRFIW
jgi:alpha-1,2-glucosyltransferase